MSTTDADRPALEVDADTVSNVFLLMPAMDAREDESCVRLSAGLDPSETNLLFVTLTGSPDDRIDSWRAHSGDSPARLAVVGVEETRSATAAPGDVGPDGITVRTVSSPGDLTQLGIRLSSQLSAWADAPGTIRVCFRSLTSLLQYVDERQVFRFLHVLTGRIRSVDAVAHYHMDPSAHDEQVVNTLRTLFDAVVAPDGDDNWTIERR